MTISLLSNLDKVFEKLMHNRPADFLEKNNILYPLQLSCREDYSTACVLIHLANWIFESPDKEKLACRIFVDLQKAFDLLISKVSNSRVSQGSVLEPLPLLIYIDDLHNSINSVTYNTLLMALTYFM